MVMASFDGGVKWQCGDFLVDEERIGITVEEFRRKIVGKTCFVRSVVIKHNAGISGFSHLWQEVGAEHGVFIEQPWHEASVANRTTTIKFAPCRTGNFSFQK